MRPTPKIIIGTMTIAITVITILVYAYFESRDYLSGPKIEVLYPKGGSTVYGPIIEIRGTAKNTTSLFLNDSQVLIDQSNAWNEKLPLPVGYNIMKLVAKDRFGKQTEKLLEFVVASSTAR